MQKFLNEHDGWQIHAEHKSWVWTAESPAGVTIMANDLRDLMDKLEEESLLM